MIGRLDRSVCKYNASILPNWESCLSPNKSSFFGRISLVANISVPRQNGHVSCELAHQAGQIWPIVSSLRLSRTWETTVSLPFFPRFASDLTTLQSLLQLDSVASFSVVPVPWISEGTSRGKTILWRVHNIWSQIDTHRCKEKDELLHLLHSASTTRGHIIFFERAMCQLRNVLSSWFELLKNS